MTKAVSNVVAVLASSILLLDESNSSFVQCFAAPPVYQMQPSLAHRTSGSSLNYAPESNEDISSVTSNGAAEKQRRRQLQAEIAELTKRFASPVLKEHCIEMLEWIEVYGHPNIPLKNDGGNACQVLRRLHVQKKLTDDEVEWLEEIGFRFHSIEDVYRFADFDEMLGRLLAYEAAHPNNNFQVPKKCPEDPELGAWVTGIRRLGKEGVNPEHERRLCAVDFAWHSTRKCGSKFMKQYREWTQQVELQGIEAVLGDSNTIAWIKAQQLALKRGTLSQTRVQYMGTLFGERWTTIGKDSTEIE
mmetsp:Transcript_18124/g.37179  ORF Transcript_18124/g.37179 Transcript_18124/m.37179 type:complete len:302 (-) Transcript_18124:57-962(-)|eukprot:CAMPEP_0201152506 /NCGR_PEP_ID=MMETSP0851-20130426/13165_1 /ASSEMBLY_ACC=CAM_ASM_000631 /TAXON_ID=183588 /ORGANISM="Pseudo-nitzschia fraudulenta, Strain WWA7" /LENGTH=301 /DNA_ID=CAMNT_0047429529 /DNA_START=162 /DNA_END=1067 /DNA_ORIENTATION=+